MREHGYLDVPSRLSPGRIYRIPVDPGLVMVFNGPKLIMRLCLVPLRRVPRSELVLVHKLLLEGMEEEYWRQANRMIGGWWGTPDSTAVEIWTANTRGVLGRR